MISFSPDDSKTYGKKVSDLQSGVTVDGDGVLHGTLHYVTEYDGYSKGAEGNFLAMSIDATPEQTVKFDSNTDEKPAQQMDSTDRTLVWKVRDTSAEMTITVDDRSDTYKASGLTLEPKPSPVAAVQKKPIKKASK